MKQPVLPTDPVEAEGKSRGIQSVVIGFKILEKIAEASTPLSLKNLAIRTEIAASKLRFYLLSFLELGLVSQDPTSGHYSLGPAALKLGLSALEKVDVVRISRAEIPGLADSLGYTVFMAVWGSHGPTVVDRLDGRNRTVLEVRVGSVLPISTSAVGMVYAAFLPSFETAALLKKEMKDRIDTRNPSRTLQLDFEQIKRQVHATKIACASGTLLAGYTALASPILDRTNLPLAVLSVIGPIGRMDDSPDGAVAQALLEVTSRLSRQIGWTGPSAPP